jgi:FkbM family methyltransferase
MLIPFDKIIEKLSSINMEITGALHIGAHECEELNDYETYISRDRILWIEAIPNKVAVCKNRYSNLNIEQAVVSDKVETILFKVANNGQSSSILDFGLHSHYHPNVHYIGAFNCETKLLRDILPKYNIEYNFLNLDIQGAELKALKGMEEYLPKVDYIYTEVNSDYVYKDCSLITELDDYLKQYGLVRVETKWTDCKWGDAFYMRV